MNKAVLPIEELLALSHESIDDALSLIEQYSELEDEDLLQRAVTEINLVRGVAAMLGLKSCADLCSELIEVIQTDGSLTLSAGNTELVGSSFLTIKSCIDTQCASGQVMPELVTPQVNALRRINSKPILSLGHYHSLGAEIQFERPARADITDRLAILKRLRQMYQFGVTKLIKANDPQASLQMIKQATSRLPLFGQSDSEALVWVATTEFISELNNQAVSIDMPIKQVFLQLDRLLSQTFKREAAGQSAPIECSSLLETMLYLLRLAVVDDGNRLLKHLKFSPLSYGLSDLIEQRSRMAGPDGSTQETVADIFIENLTLCRDALSQWVASEQRDDIEPIRSGFERLCNVAYVLQWAPIAQRLGRVQELVARIQSQYSDEALAEIIHELVVVDTVVERVRQGNECVESESANEYLMVAQSLSYQEIISSFNLTKRALSAYVDADFDTSHIANVPQALSASAGALTILKQSRAASLVKRSVGFVSETLIDSAATSVTPQLLAGFADALIAVEFYVSQVAAGENDENVLSVADQSLAAVGAN